MIQAPEGGATDAPISRIRPSAITTVPFSIVAPLTVTIRASRIATSDGVSAATPAPVSPKHRKKDQIARRIVYSAF
jgi:hypothetical protein